MLKKSGVALKRITIPQKRAPGAIRAPLTPQELRRKLLASKPSGSKGTTGTKNTASTKAKRSRITESDDYSDSDQDDNLALAEKRMFGRAATTTTAKVNVVGRHNLLLKRRKKIYDRRASNWRRKPQ